MFHAIKVGGGWMSDYDVVPLALPACAPLSFNGGFTTHQVRHLLDE